MRVQPRRRTLFALALLAALAGCAETRAKRQAESLVRAYDEALASAYRQTDVTPVKDLVTAKELKKLIALIDLKASNRIVLESTLERLEVTAARPEGPDRLVVESQERWRYYDRPLAPGKPPGIVYVADMVMRYEFVREGGHWKMDQGKTLTCTYLEPKGFKLGNSSAGISGMAGGAETWRLGAG